MAGSESFNKAIKELENEQKRGQVQNMISASAGKFWRDYESEEAKDKDGNPVQIQQVRVIERSDGTRSYIMADNGDGEHAILGEDGKTNFITDEEIRNGLEDGSIVSDRVSLPFIYCK